jgi:hypothetical protein
METNIHFLSYLSNSSYFLECAMFRTKFVEKTKTHFILNDPPPKFVLFIR